MTAQSKHQFYRKGPDNQRTSDVTVDLRRLDKAKIAAWSAEDKNNLIDFMMLADAVYQAFKEEILNACANP